MTKGSISGVKVSQLQILDEKGNLDKKFEPDLGRDELIETYRWMVLARAADERMLKLQRQGRIGTFGPSSGQEACVVGAAQMMREDDWFVAAFRELGGRLLRGEPLEKQFLYYNGYEEGNVMPETAPRLLPTSVIVGAQLPHAAGIG